MKKILALVLVLASTQAFATKARYKSLMSSTHLVDTQSQFTSPYHVFSIPDFVSFESGKTEATSVDDGAEMITKFSLNDSSKLLVAIGHKDEAAQSQRKFLNAVAGTTFITQQNPVEVIYGLKAGDITWAGGVYYSSFKDKLADNNEQSTGLRLSASHGDFKWKVNLGLNNKVQNTTDGTMMNQPYTNVGLRYGIGKEHKLALDYSAWNVKMENTTGTETQSHEYQNIKFQYVNTTQADGNDFFYGIAVDQINLKNKIADKKLNRLALPVWFGVEHNANEMFTVRASIKQTIYAQSKDEQGYPVGSVDGGFATADSEFTAEPNNTEVSTGLGWKFKQVMIDGLFKALVGKTATQQVNSANLLSQVGLTYNY